MQQEFLLFFSNFCNYSKDVLGIITRKNIRNAFILICVDTLQSIPPFVDRVPLIVRKQSKEVYADDDISKIIDDITNMMYPPTKIEALPSTFGGGLQDTFQDSEFEPLGGGPGDSFTLLDMSNYRINCMAEDDTIKNKKADSSQLEQYISQRDTDIKIMMDRPTLR